MTTTDRAGNAATAERVVARVQITKYYYHGGQRVALRQGQALYFLHSDHLGSTSLTTDAAGNVVARRRYAPYGKERWAAGTLPTDFGFTGQRDVPGTGLMYYRARYYHPALGRFISADTLVPEPGNPQSLNRYAYVLNNPLKYTDPSGHFEDAIVKEYSNNAAMKNTRAGAGVPGGIRSAERGCLEPRRAGLCPAGAY